MKSGTASANPVDKPDTAKPADKPDTAKPAEAVQPTKMERATALYIKLITDDEHIPRKDIIDEFVKKCDLTPSGAATYFNTIKKRHTNKKA